RHLLSAEMPPFSSDRLLPHAVVRLLKYTKEWHVGQVNADERFGMAASHVLGHHASPIASVYSEARITQFFDHQFVQQIAKGEGQSSLPRPVRKTETRQARYDHVK